jgi:hypothetical protein
MRGALQRRRRSNAAAIGPVRIPGQRLLMSE